MKALFKTFVLPKDGGENHHPNEQAGADGRRRQVTKGMP